MAGRATIFEAYCIQWLTYDLLTYWLGALQHNDNSSRNSELIITVFISNKFTP